MSAAGDLLPDWETAGAWAGRLAPPGPTASRTQAQRLVAGLHDAAHRAGALALHASGLNGVVDVAPAPQVLVVDRARWARAAARSFAALTPGVGRAASATTAQAAALLALLAGRVLGQFDPFGGETPGGRLLLVAPNVLRFEQVLRVPADDFRLWVCVHEQTHALQFAAAPWLADHLRAEAAGLLAGVIETSTGHEMAAALRSVVRAARTGEGEWSLFDVLPAAERDRAERLTAVMSLLEGHADVTMDAVGPRQIPSARTLRRRLDARRRSTGPDRVLRRVLGLDAKLAQYRRGAAFVRAVRAAGGPHALDPVWSGPQALPSPAEIADPRAWVRRWSAR